MGSSPPGTARCLLKKLGEAKNCKAHVHHACNDVAWLMDWPCTHWPGLWSLGTTGHISVGPCMHPMHVGAVTASATGRFNLRVHSGICVCTLRSCKCPGIYPGAGCGLTPRGPKHSEGRIDNLTCEITRQALGQCHERSSRAMLPKLQCHPASCIAPQMSLAIGD